MAAAGGRARLPGWRGRGRGFRHAHVQGAAVPRPRRGGAGRAAARLHVPPAQPAPPAPQRRPAAAAAAGRSAAAAGLGPAQAAVRRARPDALGRPAGSLARRAGVSPNGGAASGARGRGALTVAALVPSRWQRRVRVLDQSGSRRVFSAVFLKPSVILSSAFLGSRVRLLLKFLFLSGRTGSAEPLR